jgi:elongation factor 1-gamma
MALAIYSYPGDYRVTRAQILAAYAGIDLEVRDSKAPEYKQLCPTGKSVVLSTPTGSIFGGNAVARYLARLRSDSGLYGHSNLDTALVDQWVDFSAHDLEPPCQIWLLPVKGVIAFNGKHYSDSRKDVEQALGVLNDYLQNETYLVGNRISLADIAVATALIEMYTEVFDPKFRERFVNLNRWFDTMVNQRPFQEIVGKVELAKQEKRAPKPPKEVEEKEQKGGAQQQQGGNKQQQQQQGGKQQQQQGGKQQGQQQGQQGGKPQQQQKPKEDKKDKDDEGPDDDVPREAKKKSALDSLPPSSMSLDATKKDFWSEKPYNKNFFNTFWEKLDAAGFSLYEQLYNYNNENKVFFMTCNQLGGFLQRCDAVRKYGMGVMSIIGPNEDDGPFEVQGAWLFRGPQVPDEMTKENPDAEYYTWKKVDPSNPSDRKRFEAHFTADNLAATTGKVYPVLERRYFK